MSKQPKDDAVHQPADKLFKAALTDLSLAKKVINRFVSKDIRQLIDLDSLKAKNTSFLGANLQAFHADVVLEARFNDGGLGYVVFLKEAQSKPDSLMLVRLMEYICQVIRHYMKNGAKYFPIVVPVIYYTGTQKWNVPLNFFDNYIDPRVAKTIMSRPVELVDVSQMKPAAIRKDPEMGVVLGALQAITQKNDWSALLQDILKKGGFDQLYSHDRNHFVEIIFGVIIRYTDINSDAQELLIKKLGDLDPALGEKAMTAAERIKQDGMQQGINVVAEKMLQNNMDLDTVANLTGLSSEVLSEIQKTLH